MEPNKESTVQARSLVRPRDVEDVFISYARVDGKAVKRIRSGLEEAKYGIWVDWSDIAPSEEWLLAIKDAIRRSRVFLFVISPSSLASKTCMLEEVKYALALQKKIVPVVIEEFDSESIPEPHQSVFEQLSMLNYVFVRPHDSSSVGVGQIVEAIASDFGHVREHTHYLIVSERWESAKKPESQLLRGDELEGAEAWLTGVGARLPPANDVQIAFIRRSRKAEDTRRRKLTSALTSVLLVVSFLGGVAWVQWQNAEEEARRARDQLRLGVAERYLTVQPDLSADLLLDVEDEELVEGARWRDVALRVATEPRAVWRAPGTNAQIAQLCFDDQINKPRLIIATDEGDVSVRSWQATQPAHEHAEHQNSLVWKLRWCAQTNCWISLSSDRRMLRWKPGQGDPQTLHSDREVEDFVLNRGGRYLWVLGHDGEVLAASLRSDADFSAMTSAGTGFDQIFAHPVDGRLLAVRGHAIELLSYEESGAISAEKLVGLAFSEDGPRTVESASISPDGRWLAVSLFWLRTVLYEVRSDRSYDLTPDWGTLCFSSDSQFVAHASSDTVRVFELRNPGRLVRSFPDSSSPIGWANGCFYFVSRDRWLTRLDPEQPDRPLQLSGHQERIVSLAISHAGRFVATGSMDGYFRVWPTSVPRIPKLLSHSSPSEVLLVTDGEREDRVAVVYGDSGGIYDVALEGSDSKHHPMIRAALCAARAEGRREFAIGHDDGMISVWQLPQFSSSHFQLPTEGSIESIAWHPAQRMVVARDSGDHLFIADLDSGSVNELESFETIGELTIDPEFDGFLATAAEKQEVCLWNWKGELVAKTGPHPDALVEGVSLLPGGRQLVSATSQGVLRLWDRSGEGFRLTDTHQAHSDVVSQLALVRADSERVSLLTAGWDGSVGQVHVGDSLDFRRISQPGPELSVLCRTTNDEWVAGGKGTARIFNLRREEQITLPLEELKPNDAVEQSVCVVFPLPDGSGVITGTLEGSVYLWPDGESIYAEILDNSQNFIFPVERTSIFGSESTEMK